MVASAEPRATEVGVRILRNGGNAVDAAVAVAFALAVTYPQAGNLGGGGFLLLRRPGGKATALDYRETAPARATRDIFLDARGELRRGEGSSTVGYRAAGVPGTVAGMARALSAYGSGKFSWSQLLEPARRLAADGFPASDALARSLRAAEKLLAPYADSRRIFLHGGRFVAAGSTFRQPELAETLARLQRGGPPEFYEGETARRIVADMARHDGLITAADLKGYAARERVPVRGTYRGFPVLSMPPPSSGGVALLEMLNVLEGYDLRRFRPDSVERLHLLVEAMRRAFADRAEYGGDADFVSVPVAGLIDKRYAAGLRAGIDRKRATPSGAVRAGKPHGAAAEAAETTHFTIVDRDGGAVANTYTLNGAYGSGVTAAGTGVLLNNEMDDFAAKVGVPNAYGLIQGERNAVAPGKRPLSSMSPTFVLRRDGGALWFAIGSPGGPTIINTVLQVVTNVVDHDMNLRQALDTPRIHHQWLPDEIVYEPGGLSPDVRRALAARGHRLTDRPRRMGDAHGVLVEAGSGMRLGASDPRGTGAARGH
jgi:gamma-glutamyltranspeptidase/glutathione hydrolase